MSEYDNPAVATILDTAADLLEISGADKFRFLSYRKAAHALRAWPEDVTTLAGEERLTDVPGIGKKLAASIVGVLERGSFPELDELTAALPPSLVTLMQVPGVGPKKAKMLYESLGVSSIDDLEAALSEGTVASLPGFGAKTAANIALGVQSYRSLGSRVLLADALPLAERIVAHLLVQSGVCCKRSSPHGADRRHRRARLGGACRRRDGRGPIDAHGHTRGGKRRHQDERSDDGRSPSRRPGRGA
jgi:DNA polymerase (family 10)